MNIFVNGLNHAIKTHVILNQPKTYAEAVNLARLRDSVSKTSACDTPQMSPSIAPQEQRIKELEGQVILLFSLANESSSSEFVHSHAISTTPNPASAPIQAINPLEEMQAFKNDIIAAIRTELTEANRGNNNTYQPRFRRSSTFVRGRNLRTTDGRPICKVCNRVGHVARSCWENLERAQQTQFRRHPRGFVGQEAQQSSCNPLDEMEPSQWG